MLSWRRPYTARCTTMLQRSSKSALRRGGKPLKSHAFLSSENKAHEHVAEASTSL